MKSDSCRKEGPVIALHYILSYGTINNKKKNALHVKPEQKRFSFLTGCLRILKPTVRPVFYSGIQLIYTLNYSSLWEQAFSCNHIIRRCGNMLKLNEKNEPNACENKSCIKLITLSDTTYQHMKPSCISLAVLYISFLFSLCFLAYAYFF